MDVKTREEITSLIAHHVTAVNYIYRNTKFDGRTEHRNIRFEVSLRHNKLLSPSSQLQPQHRELPHSPLALCQQCATRTKHVVLLVLFKLKVKLWKAGEEWLLKPRTAQPIMCEKWWNLSDRNLIDKRHLIYVSYCRKTDNLYKRHSINTIYWLYASVSYNAFFNQYSSFYESGLISFLPD